MSNPKSCDDKGTNTIREGKVETHQVAVSLGKPSLRTRLEAYYSLIAPEIIVNDVDWRARFEQIWTKYGGTDDGEQKLATKLAKKYGLTVRLLLASSVATDKGPINDNNVGDDKGDVIEQRSEDWYDLTTDEQGSRIVDFISNRFDPVAALSHSMIGIVQDMHPWLLQSPILDRVDQFRKFLPLEDPQYRSITANNSKKRNRSNDDNAADDNNKTKLKTPSCFASIAHVHQKGPFSILYQALIHRQRIRVVIRYVNGIRGTLTGYMVAFDKHMNLILRDVDENYSPRHVTTNNSYPDLETSPDVINNNIYSNQTLSNVEIELQRRRIIHDVAGVQKIIMPSISAQNRIDADQNIQNSQNQQQHSWTNRQRHIGQIMVRGDNVVLVYKADQERSAWPITSKSPQQSIYRKVSCSNTSQSMIPTAERVGTPGSLIYAFQRRQQQLQRQHDQTRSNTYIGSNKRDYSSKGGK
jgi:small nuclear ribonucleoprotein (snRNP)-like protein